MDFESSVEMRDEFTPMDEETTLYMDESGTVCLRLRRGAPSIDMNDVANFEMNTDSETINYACKDVLQKSSKNRRHKNKKKYFDTVAAKKVSTKSSVPDLTDGEWQALVQMWSTPRHKETCVLNKINREKVVYQQRTGSRHYTTHIFATKLERWEVQAEVMQEEMAAIKLKVEEYEAARDKELELLCKKSQE
ncbi:hypothetical protein D1007_10487 [Hordeum vulgare]|nr:hypothetical protein D1007_10487 [Hordeum vulgare]